MRPTNHLLTTFSGAMRYVAFGLVLCGPAHAQSTANQGAHGTLIEQMAGTWKVEQRMWSGFGSKATPLPRAVANRVVLTGGFLQEVMEAENKLEKDPFKRIAYFNYNAVSRQFEYFSIDSRAPQMMNERSKALDSASTKVDLDGGRFVAPQWGDAKDVAFAYRLTVGPIESDRQIVQLYLKPVVGTDAKEFLAFEYVYTRER